MGVSFGEVIGDVQPESSDARDSAPPKPETPTQVDPIVLRREVARLGRRDARLRAS